MLLRSMQNTRLSAADAKAENDALRDDAAAGRRLHIEAVCQSVREATCCPAWIMQPPDWQTLLNGIISPSGEEADHYANNQGTQKYINEQCR